MGPGDRPVDHESGFRWRHSTSEQVPVFYWRDTSATPPDHPSGFRFSDVGESDALGETDDLAEPAQEGTPGHVSGFKWRAPSEGAPLFMWGLGTGNDASETGARPDQQPGVPWYFSWLPPKKPSGFRWKPKDH